MKRKTYYGQSTLEYIGIVILVMAGILVIGPHVIRSVNAYFKTAEDQSEDSFREEFYQTPLDNEEKELDMGPDCNCSTNWVCGDGTDCALYLEMSSITCTPTTCEDELVSLGVASTICRPEADPVPSNTFDSCFPQCNLATGDLSDCPEGTSGDAPSLLFNGCGYRCCLSAEPVFPIICGAAGTYSDGHQLMVRKCGETLSAQYFWELSGACTNNCGVKDVNADWCTSEIGMTYAYNSYVVSPGDIFHLDWTDGSCTDRATAWGCDMADVVCLLQAYACAAECDRTFCANPTGTTCECLPGWRSRTITGACPPGFTEQAAPCPVDTTAVDIDFPPCS